MYRSTKLKREFYKRNTLDVAKELIGKYLIHKSSEGATVGRIVETEAYIGPQDRASHAYEGKLTERTKIQFGPGGYAYIYQIYGINYCFNVVTEEPRKPEVVLIRALEPIDGIELMAKRRKNININKNLNHLTNGPSKLCQAMAIDKSLYGIDLCGGELFLASANNINNNNNNFTINIAATPRINIDYAGEAKNYLWRFFLEGNPFISKK